ncbi:MAG TPA: hypothetical protein DC019_05920 [Ruminococcus sp.]|nr:hypothetical protein [Ruminococcus sp.]
MVWMGRVFILVARTEPQATAVKLAQLGGEGLLRGTSCPLNKGIDSMNLKSRRSKQMLFAILET